MTLNGSAKADLRKQLQAKRKLISDDDHASWSRSASRQLLRQLEWSDQENIALFWPLGREIDTSALRISMHHLGAKILLPRTLARATPLSFHEWTPQTKLERSQFGVEEPSENMPALDPSVIVVPLLGFDSNGFRLGYGAGHYDCTLAAMHKRGLTPQTIGLAFELQRLDEVPTEDHDIPLDIIVTEAGCWHSKFEDKTE